ncbi:MAG: phage tail-like protein [Ilumatobacter sp.]|jgi:phage tail-like protein
MAVTTEGTVADEELVGSWFSVELENGIVGEFSEVGGLDLETVVVEFTDANTDTISRKRPGTTSYSDLTLKRTLTADKSFWDWAKKIRDGNMEYRTNGSVVVYDMSGTEKVRWNVTNVWPSKWAASDLDVGSDDLMQEDITLQCELVKRV